MAALGGRHAMVTRARKMRETQKNTVVTDGNSAPVERASRQPLAKVYANKSKLLKPKNTSCASKGGKAGRHRRSKTGGDGCRRGKRRRVSKAGSSELFTGSKSYSNSRGMKRKIRKQSRGKSSGACVSKKTKSWSCGTGKRQVRRDKNKSKYCATKKRHLSKKKCQDDRKCNRGGSRKSKKRCARRRRRRQICVMPKEYYKKELRRLKSKQSPKSKC